jgi:transcription elongation factor GreB
MAVTMGRERLRSTPSTQLITPEGLQHLRDELDHLWRVERPKVTQAVSDAAAMGDRSENAEYIYGKKRLREIDRRVRYLQKRIPDLKVVDRAPDDPRQIFFGAWVRLEDQDRHQHEYRIVGPDEFDPARGWISIDAPLARALLKKTVDDEVTVMLPKGETTFFVIAVQYRPFGS